MKKMVIMLAIASIFLFITCNTTGGERSEKTASLSTDEIQTLFSGKTSNRKKKKSGWELKIYTAPDGEQIVRFITGKKAGEKRVVRWSAENNMHCTHRDGKKFCGEIISIGDGVYHKVRDGKVKSVITDFVVGNQL